MQPPDFSSQHPVDQLIVRLIREKIEASPGDLQRIVDHMATAPFNRHPVRVRARDRGLSYGGVVIGRIADPLDLHLAKRVVQEEQWTPGTTAHEYLDHIKSAIRHPQAQILVYERSGDLVAATIMPTADIVPADRQGVNVEHNLLVVYSARHGSVLSGYMFSALEKLNLPERIRWLR